ncbi:MAG: dihydropteroate synthase [Spirochaetia bacterium]|nr:dihydropteroate synthase [Spirochaetia bacterium]
MLEFKLKDRTISTERNAFVAGIVNVNNDSFWKGSRGGFSLAKRLILEKADILDIGAESSRPGSKYISEKDELKALIPLIRKIRKFSDIPISVDTRKKNVFEACMQEGADILNDISALEDDSQMARYAGNEKIPVILMHKRKNPDIMQKYTEYEDVFKEVEDYLYSRIQYAVENGIDEDKIIIDPGIGFAKDLHANLVLIKNCGRLCSGKYPLMMALSRKSFLGLLTGKTVDKRLAGTVSANLYSVINGAKFVRVHDVKEAVDSLDVLKGILNAGS